MVTKDEYLTGEEVLKIANGVKKEHFKQTIEKRQGVDLSKPSVWNWIIAFLFVCLSVGTIVVFILQGIPK